MHYQYPCKVMDSWPLSSATLKSWNLRLNAH
jgi:hypothetical protein